VKVTLARESADGVRTVVEPEDKRLLVGVGGGLQEPVEEGAAVRLVHGHVAGVLREPHRWLPREPLHAVGRLLCRGHGVHRCATDTTTAAQSESASKAQRRRAAIV
jgi:hypothetical protein